jgi:hypothetical protein
MNTKIARQTKVQKLIQLLETGDEFNIFRGDVQTYRWVVNVGNPQQKLSLGGGNLTVTTISVISISNLAKCYVLLNNSYKLRPGKKKLSENNLDETDAFIQLVQNLDSSWGYSKRQLKTFWKRVRHKLVHSAYPKAGIYPPHFTEPCESPFDVTGGVYLIRPDCLWTHYENMKSDLVTKLTAGHFH